MKFTIKNLQSSDRKVPLPGGKTVPIKANGTVVQVYPQGLQSFFKALTKIDFEVKMEASAMEQRMNAKFAVAQVRPAAPAKPVKKEAPKKEEKPVVKEEPKKVEEATEAPVVEEAKAEEAKDEVLSREEVIEKLREMKAELLRVVCDKLNISTNSMKVTTLVGKISNSSASDEELLAAYNAAK